MRKILSHVFIIFLFRKMTPTFTGHPTLLDVDKTAKSKKKKKWHKILLQIIEKYFQLLHPCLSVYNQEWLWAATQVKRVKRDRGDIDPIVLHRAVCGKSQYDSIKLCRPSVNIHRQSRRRRRLLLCSSSVGTWLCPGSVLVPVYHTDALLRFSTSNPLNTNKILSTLTHRRPLAISTLLWSRFKVPVYFLSVRRAATRVHSEIIFRLK